MSASTTASPTTTSLFGSLELVGRGQDSTRLRLPGALDGGGFGGQTEKNLGRNAMLS